MRTRILLAAVLLSLGLAPAPLPRPKKSTPKEDLKSLQGSWEVVSLGKAGMALPTDKKAPVKFLIRNDLLDIKLMEKSSGEAYRIVLGALGKEKTIDLTRVGSKAQTVRGLYVLQGDVFKLYYLRAPGRDAERPRAIDTKDPNLLVMTLRRQKR